MREELTPRLEDVEAFARGAPSGEGRCGAVNFSGVMWWGFGRKASPSFQSSYVFMSPV